jgi:hypothetical protein
VNQISTCLPSASAGNGGYEIAKAVLKTACSSGLLNGCCGRTDSRRGHRWLAADACQAATG